MSEHGTWRESDEPVAGSLRDALQSARLDDVDDASVDRVWLGVRRRVREPRARRRWMLALVFAPGVAAAATGTAWWLSRERAQAPVTPAVTQAEPESFEAVEVVERVDETMKPAKTATPRSLAAAPQSRDDQARLREEVEILWRCRSSLESAPDQALAAVEEHRRRFPDGVLAEERDLLGIKVLIGLGRAEEAARAAEEFRVRYPESGYLGELGRAP